MSDPKCWPEETRLQQLAGLLLLPFAIGRVCVNAYVWQWRTARREIDRRLYRR